MCHACSDAVGGKRLPVDRNNLLLRGCVLRNTTRIAGLVVYAGQCCACVCVCIHMYIHIVVITQRQDSMSPARANAVLSLRLVDVTKQPTCMKHITHKLVLAATNSTMNV